MNKVAVVTCSSSGIGLQMLKLFPSRRLTRLTIDYSSLM